MEGAWLLGAGCRGAGAVEDVLDPGCSSPEPLPGVMGPSTPDNGGGAWGEGASGTAGCCWATAAGLNIGLKFRSAASAIAVKPSFTGISPVVSGQ